MTAATVHGTTIAFWSGGAWRGVMLQGPSGAGKSSLAIRAMRAGWRLVADDRTLLWTSGGALFGRSPDTISGLVEVRGLGVLHAPALRWAQVRLVVDLVESGSVDRMPEPAVRDLAGTKTPVLALWPHDAAAETKLVLALEGVLACDAAPPWSRAATSVSSSAPCARSSRGGRGPLMRNR